MERTSYTCRSGFTLIELSIVLVIIGLIIGGILVGQNLIHAAEIRATISQVENFKSAINTFKVKYADLPGDISASKAAAFGFITRSGEVGHGDGNALLEGCSSDAPSFGCETAFFWSDLSQAGLIGGSFTSATDALTTLTTAVRDSYLPAAKLGNGNYFSVFSYNGSNYFFITNMTGGAPYYSYGGKGLTPYDAWSIDLKLDDGLPGSGTPGSAPLPLISAYDSPQPTRLTNLFAARFYPDGVISTNACLQADANSVIQYATTDSNNANSPLCTLLIRF